MFLFIRFQIGLYGTGIHIHLMLLNSFQFHLHVTPDHQMRHKSQVQKLRF